MELTEFIAAIDLGTFKIAGIVGSKNPDGSLNISALEEEFTDGCIKRGYIQNVEAVAHKVKSLINKLENHAKCKIGKLHVGIAGHSLGCIEHRVRKSINEETAITDATIQALKEESLKHLVGNKEILDIIPACYYVDGRSCQHPIGMYGNQIEASHKLIIARPILKKNIQRVMERLDLEIASYILSPLAASSVLTQSERNQGVILVDMGAGTTTVSIYKDDNLISLCVIPLGGDTITKDIMALQILEDEAERLKTTIGNASPSFEEKEDKMFIPLKSASISNSQTIRKFHRAIFCRSEEIVENIMAQVRLAGFEPDHFLAGYIITGGGAYLSGFKTLLEKKTRSKVRVGNTREKVIHSLANEVNKDLSLSVLLGLLRLSNGNCAKPTPVVEEVPVPLVHEEEEVEITTIEDHESTVNSDMTSTEEPRQQEIIQAHQNNNHSSSAGIEQEREPDAGPSYPRKNWGINFKDWFIHKEDDNNSFD